MGKEIPEDWYEQVLTFILDIKKKGILTDYNQIAFLCRSVKNDKIIDLILFRRA